jgi:hypothetical protein
MITAATDRLAARKDSRFGLVRTLCPPGERQTQNHLRVAAQEPAVGVASRDRDSYPFRRTAAYPLEQHRVSFHLLREGIKFPGQTIRHRQTGASRAGLSGCRTETRGVKSVTRREPTTRRGHQHPHLGPLFCADPRQWGRTSREVRASRRRFGGFPGGRHTFVTCPSPACCVVCIVCQLAA